MPAALAGARPGRHRSDQRPAHRGRLTQRKAAMETEQTLDTPVALLDPRGPTPDTEAGADAPADTPAVESDDVTANPLERPFPEAAKRKAKEEESEEEEADDDAADEDEEEEEEEDEGVDEDEEDDLDDPDEDDDFDDDDDDDDFEDEDE